MEALAAALDEARSSALDHGVTARRNQVLRSCRDARDLPAYG
jgi:hypothetical protein